MAQHIREEDRISKFIPCITHDYLNELAGNHNIEDVQNLLRILGVRDNIVTMSSQNYYRLLLKLQDTVLVPGDFDHSVTGEKSQKVTREKDQKSHLTPLIIRFPEDCQKQLLPFL